MARIVTARVSLEIKEKWEELHVRKYKSSFELQDQKVDIKEEFGSPVSLRTLYKMFKTSEFDNPPRRKSYVSVCEWLGIPVDDTMYIIDLKEKVPDSSS